MNINTQALHDKALHLINTTKGVDKVLQIFKWNSEEYFVSLSLTADKENIILKYRNKIIDRENTSSIYAFYTGHAWLALTNWLYSQFGENEELCNQLNEEIGYQTEMLKGDKDDAEETIEPDVQAAIDVILAILG